MYAQLEVIRIVSPGLSLPIFEVNVIAARIKQPAT